MALCSLQLMRSVSHVGTRLRIERGGQSLQFNLALRSPPPAPASLAQPFQSKGTVCRSYSGPGSGSATSSARREAALEQLRKELRALEEERDAAVSTAESCARTCVRLTDMSKLLEDLALEKLKAGDEAGAKMVLQEKASLKEIIDKSNSKAQTNFSLAGKLANKIGDKHSQLVALMGAGSAAEQQRQQEGGGGYSGYGGAAAASTSGRTAGGQQYGAAWPQPSAAAPSSVGGYGSGAGGAYGGGGGAAGGGYQMPWERSIAEAQQRARQAEAEAQRMGRLAAMSAEDSIAAARERLAARGRPAAGGEGILQARERLRRAAEASIAEARERLRSQDAAVLEYCRRIVARYRRGEPVAEEELEFAFEQLERRLL